MRLFWAAGAAALAIWSATPGIVNAEPMDDGNLAIGVGIICNTPEQMDRLVGLRNDGKEMVPAVTAVNDVAKIRAPAASPLWHSCRIRWST